ncbi:type IV secretory system conjugative DNA transfer family protein [Eggerthella sp. YY7918]|uniref:type IV secretory system conjugative DNA transfer family protein n=1 Tax=Eggerthella sp. (strain YY7918) TaxID=502558 RepID=UPI0002171296|nr:type IV secretory system conjugative DNA transfer family protein [Eggerthella sp. YY7918]BAK45826.1 hypothetical protein EGYY_28490 [Eggerthella sp. YY7918]
MLLKTVYLLAFILSGWALAVAFAPVVCPTILSYKAFFADSAILSPSAISATLPLLSNDITSYLTYTKALFEAGYGWSFGVVLGVVYAAMLAVSAYVKSKNPSREVSNGVYDTNKVYTSKRDIIKRCYTWNGKGSPVYGVVVGCIAGRLIIMPATHAALIAPSGSLKTRGSYYETVDLLTCQGENSLIITDPSGEIYAMMRAELESRGYRLMLIDLDEPLRGNCYNPLIAIILRDRSGDVAQAEARAREIGDTLCPEQGNENDIFMRGAGGVISAVAYLVATLDQVPNTSRHLWSVVKIVLEGTVDGADKLKDWLRGFGSDSPAVAMAATFLSADGKLESGILSSLHDALQPFTSAHLRWLTSKDDFKVTELMRERMVIFIRMLPPGNQANKLASLFFTQYINETLRQRDRASLRPVYVLGDEAHAIPKFDLVTAVEQGRKYKSHWYLWLQSNEGLDPYKTAKEDGKSAILANADVKVLYKAGTPTDADLFCRFGGERTKNAKSIGSSRNAQGGGTNEGFSENRIQNWPVARILGRDPQKDGVLVAANISNEQKCSGCYEIPIADVTKTPTAKNFSTFGTREHEARVLADEAARLDQIASKRKLSVKAWVPKEFYQDTPEKDSPNDASVFGL